MTLRNLIAPQVCAAARIQTSTLRLWRSRKLLEVEKDHAREWTKFSEPEALRVCVIAELVRSGVELRLAARVAKGLSETGGFEWLKGAAPLEHALAGAKGFAHVALCESQQAIDSEEKDARPKSRVLRAGPYTVLWSDDAVKLLEFARERSATSATVILLDLRRVVADMRAAIEDWKG